MQHEDDFDCAQCCEGLQTRFWAFTELIHRYSSSSKENLETADVTFFYFPVGSSLANSDCASGRRNDAPQGNAKAPFALAMSLVLTGCANRGTSLSPQTLTFNYAVRTVPDARSNRPLCVVGRPSFRICLRGTLQLPADFSSPTPPQVFNGVPGQTGFNVNIVSSRSRQSPATTNPPSCTALDEFEINIGGLSERWRSASRRASPMAGSG